MMVVAAKEKTMSGAVAKVAETTAAVTNPAVIGVGGMTYFGITLSDWILIGTGILLVFNLMFAVVKFRDLFRRKPNG